MPRLDKDHSSEIKNHAMVSRVQDVHFQFFEVELVASQKMEKYSITRENGAQEDLRN